MHSKASTTKKPSAATPTTATRMTLGTFTVGKAETRKCTGTCGLRLPVKKFPTTKTSGVRVSECRSCRDTRTAAGTKS